MVSFGQSIKTCLFTKFFNWRDRAPRSEYWWFIISSYILLFTLHFCIEYLRVQAREILINNIINDLPLEAAATAHNKYMILATITAVLTLYILLAQLFATVRRLHDRNISGWWIWLANIIFVILITILIMIGNNGLVKSMGNWIVLILFAPYSYIFIQTVKVGTVGPNKYGSDPLGDVHQEAAQRKHTREQEHQQIMAQYYRTVAQDHGYQAPQDNTSQEPNSNPQDTTP